jgi:hypothetical protein
MIRLMSQVKNMTRRMSVGCRSIGTWECAKHTIKGAIFLDNKDNMRNGSGSVGRYRSARLPGKMGETSNKQED